MAEVKNYGLSGVHRTLQLGKLGPKLVGDNTTDSISITLEDGATLTTMSGANATASNQFITKGQLDVVYTEATFKANVNYNDSSPILLGNITSGTKTIITTLTINTAFDDANAVVTIGTSGNNSLLMSDDYCEIENTGVYQTINVLELSNNTSLSIYVTQAAATAGAGNVLVSVVDGPVVDGGTINYGGGGSGIALTDLSVTSNSPSGNGSLSYNNTTGVFTFTPANASLSTASDRIVNGAYEYVVDVDGWLHLASGAGVIGQENEDIVVQVVDADDDGWSLNLEVTDGADVHSRIQQERDRVQIGINLTAGPSKYWAFQSTGVLDLPGDIWSNYSDNLNIVARGVTSTSFIELATQDNSDTIRSNIRLTRDVANITTSSGLYTWTFDSDGKLTLPESTSAYAYIQSDANVPINIQTTGSTVAQLQLSPTDGARIYTDDGTNGWQFDNTGMLTLPGDSTYIDIDAGNVIVHGLHGAKIRMFDGVSNQGSVGIERGAAIISVNDSSGEKIWNFSANGNLTLASGGSIYYANGTLYGGGGGDVTANSTTTFTNKTFNVQSGQGNDFQIQGTSLISYTGSGGVVVFDSSPTINSFNIGNGSGLTVDGGTGTSYWSGISGVAQAGDKKAGVYHTSSTSNNGLFTFGINGTGTMSLGVEGSLFLGTALPANHGGVTTANSGWIVAAGGIKLGGDVNTLGAVTATGNISGSNAVVTGKVFAGNVVYSNVVGTAGQVLTTYANGVTYWSTVSAGSSYGDSNVATLLSSFGSNTITTTGNISVGNITATNLGNISSVNLTGSTSTVLYGNGSFAAPAAEISFSIKTSNFNASAGSRYGVNTSSGAVTATLPASPATGDAIFFADAGGAYATNNLTIARNGKTIMGDSSDLTVSTNGQSVGLFYNGSTWRTYNAG